MGIWIFSELPCSISGVSIYDGTQTNIRVKCCASLNFFGDSISISRVSICYCLQSDIKVITYGHLNLPGASVFNFGILDIFWESNGHSIQKLWKFEFARRFFVQFRESRYVMGRNRTSESRLIAIWISPKLPCRISSIAVYVGSQWDIHVKCYSGLNMLQLSCLSIFKSKVISVGISLELSSFTSGVSICYGPQSETWVKSYCSLDFPVDSVFNFERLDILWTAIRNQVRSYGHLNLLGASMFNFGRLNILSDSNRHPSQTLY